MDASKYLKSDFMKAEDIPEDESITLTVQSVEERTSKFKDELMPALILSNEKVLTLNPTNLRSMIEYYGAESDKWIGLAVTLFAIPVQTKEGMKQGIRIKRPKATNSSANGSGNGAPAPKKWTADEVVKTLEQHKDAILANAAVYTPKLKKMAADLGADVSAAQNIAELYTLVLDFAKAEVAPF